MEHRDLEFYQHSPLEVVSCWLGLLAGWSTYFHSPKQKRTGQPSLHPRLVGPPSPFLSIRNTQGRAAETTMNSISFHCGYYELRQPGCCVHVKNVFLETAAVAEKSAMEVLSTICKKGIFLGVWASACNRQWSVHFSFGESENNFLRPRKSNFLSPFYTTSFLHQTVFDYVSI